MRHVPKQSVYLPAREFRKENLADRPRISEKKIVRFTLGVEPARRGQRIDLEVVILQGEFSFG